MTPVPSQQAGFGILILPVFFYLLSIRYCAMAEQVTALLPPDGDECQMVQSFGSLCGCPVRSDACQLCGSDDRLAIPETFQAQAIDFVIPGMEGQTSSCELAEAYLHSWGDTDLVCAQGQAYASACGCTTSSNPTDESGMEVDASSEEEEEDEDDAGQCGFCLFNRISPFPTRIFRI